MEQVLVTPTSPQFNDPDYEALLRPPAIGALLRVLPPGNPLRGTIVRDLIREAKRRLASLSPDQKAHLLALSRDWHEAMLAGLTPGERAWVRTTIRDLVREAAYRGPES